MRIENHDAVSPLIDKYLGISPLPDFVYNDILDPNCLELYDSVTKTEALHNQTVPAKDIAGIINPPFQTWFQFLSSDRYFDTRSFNDCLTKARDNIGYFSSECEKDEWNFVCIDGKYFTQNGHHRTVIAKLLAAAGKLDVIRNITVEYITYNSKLLDLIKRVRLKFKRYGITSVQHSSFREDIGLNTIFHHSDHFIDIEMKKRWSLPLRIELEAADNLTDRQVFWITRKLLLWGYYFKAKHWVLRTIGLTQ